MTLDTLSSWLRCPICFLDLIPGRPLALRCASGHSFDVTRRGYVSLLPPRTRVQGDSAAMLEARQAFLDAGHFAPIVAAMDDLLPRCTDERVLDAGCGTGHYLRGILETRPDASSLAVDLTPAAVARAVRGSARGDGLVADLWTPLPVRDGAATSILNVFAPRNPGEYARVLEPAGSLIVVVPEPDHLRELRDRGLVLGLQQDKLPKLLATMGGLFDVEEERVVSRELRLSFRDVDLLVGMGPSAHHRRDDPEAAVSTNATPSGEASLGGGGVSATAVTLAVRVLRFRRRP